MYRLFLIPALLALPHCSDETVGGYGAADRVWTLVELDGAAFPARATLTFPETGAIAGEAPCNSYAGTMTVPYPWFDARALTVTRRSCPDLPAETAFFAALESATLSEVAGDTLILSNERGRQMVFRSAE